MLPLFDPEDIEARDQYGKTPLEYALASYYIKEMVPLLMEAGARFQPSGIVRQAFFHAVTHGDEQWVNMMLDSGAVSLTTKIKDGGGYLYRNTNGYWGYRRGGGGNRSRYRGGERRYEGEYDRAGYENRNSGYGYGGGYGNSESGSDFNPNHWYDFKPEDDEGDNTNNNGNNNDNNQQQLWKTAIQVAREAGQYAMATMLQERAWLRCVFHYLISSLCFLFLILHFSSSFVDSDDCTLGEGMNFVRLFIFTLPILIPHTVYFFMD